ncbi:MAG: type II toxin-antitoxin system HicB family antitoxin [Proteobacteria bacterium]|nr:type II toxin-antitoxin system HicB family antitoxin [Pseudomonadota bacterium]
MANKDHYTYRVTWSAEDNEYIGLCAEFPSLSWLADSQPAALAGIMQVVADVVADMEQNGEPVPESIADRTYSGKFMVRVPPDTHRALATKAAEVGTSINRIVSEKLAQ